MRISISESLCTGHGRCYTVSPDLFECDDEGYVTVRGSTVVVDEEFEASARRAVNACPEDAITISD